MKDEMMEIPVYKKAWEIMDLTRAVVESIDKKKDVMLMHEQMLSNAMIIPAKIAGAEGGDAYSIRIDNAILIKLHARELQAQTSLCKVEKLCPEEYLQVLRDELQVFRKLFHEWIDSFDPLNNSSDEWDFFNKIK